MALHHTRNSDSMAAPVVRKKNGRPGLPACRPRWRKSRGDDRALPPLAGAQVAANVNATNWVWSPDLTLSSTALRPPALASATFFSTSAGVLTSLSPTERMTSPAWRPTSAAWPFGSTSVTTTPVLSSARRGQPPGRSAERGDGFAAGALSCLVGRGQLVGRSAACRASHRRRGLRRRASR